MTTARSPYGGLASYVPFHYPMPPAPPRPYTIPGGATSVTTGAGLQTALDGGTPLDIVCEDGTYDRSSAFVNNNGHRIYMRNLFGAVFTAGIQSSAGAGQRVQGAHFNITDVAKTLNDSAWHIWGPASSVSMYDCKINGNQVLQQGVWFGNKVSLDGLIIKRVLVENGIDTGLRLHSGVAAGTVTTPMLLEDIDVRGWKHATPGTLNGTGETGMYLGQPATLRRFRVRDCGWMGLCTVDLATGCLIEHFDIDDIKSNSSGIYPEHDTTDCIFQYGTIGMNSDQVLKGITLEWNAGFPTGSTHGCIFRDIVIRSRTVGIYSDQGNDDNTFQRIQFIGQCWAGIGDYLPDPLGNTYLDNDYSRIDVGAVATDDEHISGHLCGSL